MPVRLNKNCIFYHCLLLSTSSVVLQLLGFGYRILLGRLAGAQAIAVYNLVMSAYNVVLSCTLTGVALSVSRIASGYQALGEGRSIVRLIRTALILFLGLFCLLAIPFGLGRDFFAQKVLGNPQTAPALLLIVPCLFLTGFENVHKAFFYGTGQTFAPTVSETLEMLCRIVGALVLGETAVSAGIVSTPALMIMAISAISLYPVPELQNALSILRLAFLLLAGVMGVYGVLLGVIFTLNYLLSLESYGTPYFAPFAPLVPQDMKDSVVKQELTDMTTRPKSFRNRNSIRLKAEKDGKSH